MRVNFKILSGTETDREFFLVSGEKIGRSRGAVIIKDSKISSVHCKLSVSSSGTCYLKDLGSSNKILYKNERISSLVLDVGCEFTLGRTNILVTKIESSSQEIKQKPSWFEFIEKISKKNIIQNPTQLKPFQQVVHVTFLNGPNLGFKHSLTYGPRSAGFQNQDINLFWSELPKEVFTIYEAEKKLYFKPLSTNQVYINSELLSDFKEIKSGDLIVIDKLKLKIECEDVTK